VIFFHHTDNFFYMGLTQMWLALSTGVASIAFFFSIYWVLPNRKVPWRPVLRTSIVAGIVWLAAKIVYVELLLPHLDLKALYGPFYVSVGLLFWAMPRADPLCRRAVQRGAAGRFESGMRKAAAGILRHDNRVALSSA